MVDAHAVQLLVPRRRHTVTDEIVRTFDPREVFTTRVDFTTAKEIAG